jgi:argininosuccinate lyase
VPKTKLGGIKMRTHNIVGLIVRGLISQGLALNSVTADLLNKAADSYGLPLNIKDQDLQEAISFMKIVEGHNVTGGPRQTRLENVRNSKGMDSFS